MAGHDLIVIGGSAGALEALTALVAGLPADLPAAVCVVVHQPAYADSRLAEILSRSGPLPAASARDGAPLVPGVIHVAVPDRHLLVRASGGGAVLRLTHGPRENRTRPAIDPLFRSAALAFGPRTVGVVLSGALDDGTAGLWTLRERGGLAVVQDPATALISSMPGSAISEVGADHVASPGEMGPLLARLAALPAPPMPRAAAVPMQPLEQLRREVAQAEIDEGTHGQSQRYGAPSRFSCPDCGGVLWNSANLRGPLAFRCDTGHAYSAATLAEAQLDGVEDALCASLRALENAAELARARQARAEASGQHVLAARCQGDREAALQHAAVLRQLLRLDPRTAFPR